MDFRYLVETKNEFNNFLCGILIPHLYHGIKGMLKYSENVYNQIEKKNSKGAQINNPGIINIFKKTLDGLTTLNNHEIEEEYMRIKNNSGCIDWFDNLVRASFKSYVLFLTWDPKNSNSKYAENNIYENISIKDFIHKCYIISCNFFKDNPELFINKNNKKEIFDTLKICIDMAIKKNLPYNQIIQEYLNIEFNNNNDTNTKEIANIKNMVYNIINNKKYGVIPQVNTLINDDSEEENFINIENSEFKKNQLENFINMEKINQTNKNNFSKDYDNRSDRSFKSKKSNHSHKVIKSTTNEVTNEVTTGQVTTGQTTTGIEQHGGAESSLTSENYESSTILSRAELKSKEIDNIINNSSKISKNSDISSTSEFNQNSETSKISKISKKSNKSINSLNKTSSVIEILNTPPPIRKKANERMQDIFQIGGINKQKKNIKVVKNKKHGFSEKFEELESYYDSIIKI